MFVTKTLNARKRNESGIFYLKHGNGIFGRGMGKKRNKKLKKLDFYLHLFLILINKREL